MVQRIPRHFHRELLKRKRVIGSGVIDSLWGFLKKAITSEPAKNLIKSGVSKAAEAAPGLLGRLWNWVKSKVTGKPSDDKVPEALPALSKQVGDKLSDAVLGFVDRKFKDKPAAPPAALSAAPSKLSDETDLSDYKGSLPEGFGVRPLGGGTKSRKGKGEGKGISPLGGSVSKENMKVLQMLVGKSGRGVKLSHE